MLPQNFQQRLAKLEYMYPYIIIGIFILLFILELGYFKIADTYNIIDKPNHRSSHTSITIRGGGIIFSLGILIAFIWSGWEYPYFILGLVLISTISFIDDVKPTSKKVRISVHLVAAALLFYQLQIYQEAFYWVIIGIVFVIGAINAINFMDGINGITGGYAITTILTLWYINTYKVLFTDPRYLISAIIVLAVFNFFNFRTKAKCFAGDVGSVSIAFIIAFFLLQLIVKTNNFNYLLLLLLYGLDTAITILCRLIRRENVAEAHRSHFYQFLANEKKIPHLFVTAIYIVTQGIINVIAIQIGNNFFYFALTIIAAAIAFLLIRVLCEGTERLFFIKIN